MPWLAAIPVHIVDIRVGFARVSRSVALLWGRVSCSATQVTVRGTVVVNGGDEMVSAYLVSTYDFDGEAHSHLC